MPETERQRQAAGAELNRRQHGAKKQRKGRETRPFGSASLAVLRDFARKPAGAGAQALGRG